MTIASEVISCCSFSFPVRSDRNSFGQENLKNLSSCVLSPVKKPIVTKIVDNVTRLHCTRKHPNIVLFKQLNVWDGRGGDGRDTFWSKWWNWWHDDGETLGSNNNSVFLLIICCYVLLHFFIFSPLIAKATLGPLDESIEVCEIKDSKCTGLVPVLSKDEFIITPYLEGTTLSSPLVSFHSILKDLLLPSGFPDSVTPDYLNYSLWRAAQGVASQINSVLATQALLYTVGLGRGSIATTAAVGWMLKDGIGYIGRIALSKYGRQFDVNPKGWRLFADVLENTAFALEIITPSAPHLFVFIGAMAVFGRSAASVIQAATRNSFYAGFAAQRNFAEVIAKGEAQGMISKFVGIMIGLSLANHVKSSPKLSLGVFSVSTWIHMFCNIKSYQTIHLRSVNPYRASLIFGEYLLTGLAPPVKEVNDEEPLFPAVPFLKEITRTQAHSAVLSSGAREAADEISKRLQLGSKLSDIIRTKEEAVLLFNLYRDEGYILAELDGKFLVVLRDKATAQDMLKSLFQVNYLLWLEKNAGTVAASITDDCKEGGRLRLSLEYVQREFHHVKVDSAAQGWIVDGLVASPLPNRISTDDDTLS